MTALLRYLGYMATKWICFYIYQYLESGTNWKWGRIKTSEDIYYTAWMLLALPIIEMLLLAGPIYIALKQKGWPMIFVLGLTFALEFLIGWYATNQQLSAWMIVKLALSIGLFILFYRKQLQF